MIIPDRAGMGVVYRSWNGYWCDSCPCGHRRALGNRSKGEAQPARAVLDDRQPVNSAGLLFRCVLAGLRLLLQQR